MESGSPMSGGWHGGWGTQTPFLVPLPCRPAHSCQPPVEGPGTAPLLLPQREGVAGRKQSTVLAAEKAHTLVRGFNSA